MKNWKRYLSIAMTLVMLVGVLPTAAFAEGEGEGDPVPLTDPAITLTPSATVYTGGDITVTVKVEGMTGYTVTSSGGTVSEDQKTVTVVNAGTYTVTAKVSDENYVSGSFTIRPKPISDLDISVDPAVQVYNTEAKTPDVTVKHGNTTLEANNHYTLTYSNNINAGTQAKAIVTAKSTNYSGSVEKDFTIKPMPVEASAITVTIPSITYGQTPAPVVTCKVDDSTINLVKDTDYTVSYSGTDVGTQTATITLKGNYSGEKSQDFTITQKTLTSPAISAIANQTYTGSPIRPAVEVKDGDAVIPSSQYNVSYENNTNAGTAKASVTFSNNYTYTGDPVTTTFSIDAKGISGGSMSGLTAAYNPGSRPVPTITVGEKTLVKDTDFTLDYEEESGSLKITATGTGNYTGELKTTIPVLAAADTEAPVITGVTNGQTYYEAKEITATDANLEKVEIYQGSTLVSTLTPAAGATSVSTTLALDNTPYVIKAYDKVGHKTEYTVTVKKKPIDSSMIQLTIPTEGYTFAVGMERKPGVTLQDGSTTIDSGDYTVSYGNNVNAGTNTATVTVTMKNSSNYQGEATKTFTIKPKALTGDLITLQYSTIVYTGSALTPTVTVVDGSTTLNKDTDYTVSYSNNTNPGTAKVTVTLKGNYSGTLEKSFTITSDLTTLKSQITAATEGTLDFAKKLEVLARKAAYDALSDTEKATVRTELGTTWTKFINRVNQKMYSLKNEPSRGYFTYTKGTSSSVAIRIDADYSTTDVTEIRIGKYETVIPCVNYTVTQGSVVVTLSSSYLKTIKNSGTYNVYIDLLDDSGYTETVHTKIYVRSATDIPQTGDPFRMTLWVSLLGASVLALAGLGVYEIVKKKKKAQKRLEAAMDLADEPSDKASTNE